MGTRISPHPRADASLDAGTFVTFILKECFIAGPLKILCAGSLVATPLRDEPSWDESAHDRAELFREHEWLRQWQTAARKDM